MKRWSFALLVVGLCSPRLAQAQTQTGVPFQCVVTISTSTSLAAVGGSCTGVEPGMSLYLTDILFATNAGAIAADTFNTLKYGTGSACGTGTAVLWGAMTVAATQSTVIQSFKTPLKVPPANDLCWINSTAGSKFLVITGFKAPG